jgi:hypothetical protein
MTEGTTAPFKGLAVSLFGESEIKQNVVADDILTIRGASAQSADYIVCQLYDGSEKFVVGASGNVTLAGTLTVDGASSFGTSVTWNAAPVFNATPETTGVTSGLTIGQFYMLDKDNVRNFAFAQTANTQWRVQLSDN